MINRIKVIRNAILKEQKLQRILLIIIAINIGDYFFSINLIWKIISMLLQVFVILLAWEYVINVKIEVPTAEASIEGLSPIIYTTKNSKD